MPDTKYGILVGVTGRQENTAALHWAADEATRRGASVTLAHVVHPVLPPPPPSVLMSPGPVMGLGREVLADVVLAFDELTDCAVPRQEVLEHGHPAGTLVELSKEADLVVLTHRSRHGTRRIRTFSTSVSVAAHAHCPVVVVPEGMSAATDGTSEARWITVGVHEAGSPEPVLEAGFEAAALLGSPLRLVHAWRLDPLYDDVISRRVDPDWGDRMAAEMMQAAEPLMERYPDVKVDVTVLHAWPSDAIADLTDSSSLVVLGRHGWHQPLPHRIGSLARTAIHAASCPVMVVPV